MTTTKTKANIAHAIPGRIRLRLEEELSNEDRKALISDLKLSPEVKDVKVSGKSVVIEHTEENQHPWSLLEKCFPRLTRLNDGFDASVAKLTETPEVNKIVPLAFLSFGVYKALRDGAFMAGESAFAIVYIAFDLYWKFQQENVTRKIQQGMTKQQQGQLEENG